MNPFDPPVFTPVFHGLRVTFPRNEVTLIAGDLFQRGPGLHATVEIQGQRFLVQGAHCGIDTCWCDATLEEAR